MRSALRQTLGLLMFSWGQDTDRMRQYMFPVPMLERRFQDG